MRRRGSVVVIALWAIGIAALVTSSIQVFAHRQALLGIHVHDRIQARWAARGGMESAIAVMAEHTIAPVPGDAWAMIEDMEYVSAGDVGVGAWDVHHHADGQDWAGPMDEHSKFNINSNDNTIFLLIIDELAFGVMEALQDWIDEDDEPRDLGVERDYYLSLETAYEPRNGPLRSIAELELIAGVMPDDVRGEDWNLNFRLDPNEDDAGASLPWDEPDGQMQGGWASLLTTMSRDNAPAESGLFRLNLKNIDSESLQLRLGLEPAQAMALIDFAMADDAKLSTLLTQPLRSVSGDAEGVSNLTDDQLRAVFAETTLHPPHLPPPGKMNINTVSQDILYRIFPDDSTLVEELVHLRTTSEIGISSPVDFLSLPGYEPSMAAFLTDLFDTRSTVFTISVAGRTPASGIETEIIAVVDRSSVPVTILEYREQ